MPLFESETTYSLADCQLSKTDDMNRHLKCQWRRKTAMYGINYIT